jgi:hypothetical protein
MYPVFLSLETPSGKLVAGDAIVLARSRYLASTIAFILIRSGWEQVTKGIRHHRKVGSSYESFKTMNVCTHARTDPAALSD